ncbi:MAG TPA: ABC-F family ATP-binding cassette domain-containing protein [Clostridiaceae bacterium]|nr:ABC-F family ATP-binding cassette domain-containing protein [Clostridiaceae bacterium]
MSILTLENIHKTYFGKRVLDGLSLSLDFGDRLVLTGANGTGKSTLLKIISGQEEPDTDIGLLNLASGTVIGYLPQQLSSEPDPAKTCLSHQRYDDLMLQMRSLEEDMAEHPEQFAELSTAYDQTIRSFEALGGYGFQADLLAALYGLGLSDQILRRPLNTLSGGERMRSALAHIIVSRPDLLLLDEPTNHLDIDGIEWLEEWLSSFSGTVIVISHDRSFMDNIATHTALLSQGKMTVRAGNYSEFKETEAMIHFSRERELKKLQETLKHEQKVTQTMFSHRKMNQYHSREKRVAKLSRQINEVEKNLVSEQTRVKFSFQSDPERKTRSGCLIQAEDISLSYDDNTLFSGFSSSIFPQDRIMITGPNGCGKTSLLNIMVGSLRPSSGRVEINSRAKIGYMGQLLQFNSEVNTLLTEVRQADPGLTEGQGRDLLAGYGFREIDVFKRIQVLSGGERARLYLCKLLLQKPDLLLLDEPTNHLDIASREILEQALLDYDGALLSVSHDRYFIDKTARKIWGFIGVQVQEYNSYQSWRGMVRAGKANISVPTQSEQSEIAEKENNSGRKNTDTKQIAAEKRKKAAEQRQIIQTLEAIIHEQEAEIKSMEASFAEDTPAVVYEQYADLIQELEENTTSYLELLEKKDS